MVHGLHKSWKQPIAYFFTRDTIKTEQLKTLIKEIIIELEKANLYILTTVCDQGATNRCAITQLCRENSNRPEPYFVLNDHKIFTLFDPPHLIKSTRNALLKYIIKYSNTKFAKMDHIKQCFYIDKTKRFQALRKIRECYLTLKNQNRLKMKVCIAARTLSHTVAACIEQMVSNPCNNLPVDAINTAEFVHDMDRLFDSFNGRTPQPEMGKPYRRCLSNKSPHRALWNNLKPKIRSWEFISVSDGKRKSKMPFKSGWLTTIDATCQLWEICRELGFKFLRTRSLNQDPLENLFASIRNLGAQNTTPNPYQLISCFKTSILNNLITPTCNRNCEKDEAGILDNLQDFLQSDTNNTIPLPLFEVNELDTIKIPGLDIQFNEQESNTAAYVAGFLIKKFKTKLQCE
ncbi:uncharacterized protein LOC115875516 [Sitophilus oryzae]|uniref:Uncharacterized protein LOC115875516 n=1 Tax=Sitophilus oryzae TaxID=7048 RepID=A0A6J2X7K7_SITOR|nr:uncharacterized protein LOC115875516 [Sitophilus oryzae]